MFESVDKLEAGDVAVGGGNWTALHHAFTSPTPEWIDRFEEDPGNALAYAYDVILNGNELGGGSIRIHRADVQQRAFGVMGIGAEEAQEKFGFLLDAFKFGAPPHGGIALGWDRLCMLLAGVDSIREVIAFPKTRRRLRPADRGPGADHGAAAQGSRRRRQAGAEGLMLRLRVVCPADQTDAVLEILRDHAGATHLVLLRGAAVAPEGDLIAADVAREAVDAIVGALCDLRIDHTGGVTIESDRHLALRRRRPGRGAGARRGRRRGRVGRAAHPHRRGVPAERHLPGVPHHRVPAGGGRRRDELARHDRRRDGRRAGVRAARRDRRRARRGAGTWSSGRRWRSRSGSRWPW